MKPLTRDEIVGLEAYVGLRESYRDAVIAHKKSRRMAVGEKASLVFEDRETLRFQVHEMLWVERIESPEKVQHELDVYNELMPGESELSATLFIEITEAGRIREELDRLVGLDEHLMLRLGDEEVHARFDPKQLEEDRISAVQYVRFPLSEAQAALLADEAVSARIATDHPNYAREAEIPAPVRSSLVRDLAGEPAPLLVRTGADASPPPVLFTLRRVRAVVAAGSAAPAHVVIEPLAPGASLLEGDDALGAEVREAMARASAAVRQHHPRCRIQADTDDTGGVRRWHVIAIGG